MKPLISDDRAQVVELLGRIIDRVGEDVFIEWAAVAIEERATSSVTAGSPASAPETSGPEPPLER